MNDQTGENRIINKTKEHIGKGFQILSLDKTDKKKVVDKEPSFREIVFGFLFRIFVIVFFFLCGIKIVIIKRDPALDFMAFWFLGLWG